MNKFQCQGQIGIYIWLDRLDIVQYVSIKEISSGAVHCSGWLHAVLHWWPINNRAATVHFWQE